MDCSQLMGPTSSTVEVKQYVSYFRTAVLSFLDIKITFCDAIFSLPVKRYAVTHCCSWCVPLKVAQSWH